MIFRASSWRYISVVGVLTVTPIRNKCRNIRDMRKLFREKQNTEWGTEGLKSGGGGESECETRKWKQHKTRYFIQFLKNISKMIAMTTLALLNFGSGQGSMGSFPATYNNKRSSYWHHYYRNFSSITSGAIRNLCKIFQ